MLFSLSLIASHSAQKERLQITKAQAILVEGARPAEIAFGSAPCGQRRSFSESCERVH
jgi:hypothetical protein